MTDIRAVYDGLASEYDSAHSGYLEGAENQLIRQKILALGLEAPVLDIGCGTGLCLNVCEAALDGYTGVDFSREMLRQAKRRWPGQRFVQANAKHGLPFTPHARWASGVALFSANYIGLDVLLGQMQRWVSMNGAVIIVGYGRQHSERPNYLGANKLRRTRKWHQHDVQQTVRAWWGDERANVRELYPESRYLVITRSGG